MPSCFFAVGIGAHEAEDPVGVLGERRPGLLTVDDVVVALAHRRGLERGEVRPGAGLRKSLAPPVVERGHARQEFLLLRVRAELDDDRTVHGGIEGNRRRHAVELHLLEEDVLLDRSPIAAAPFLRPVVDGPALAVQRLLGRDHIRLGELAALDQLRADFERDLGLEERPHFLAEGVLFGAEAQVHGRLLGRLSFSVS